MEIHLNKSLKTILAKIPKDNSCLSKSEYIGYWNEILTYVEIFRPEFLLIDAYELCYRSINEIKPRFDAISAIVQPENIAIVMSDDILGRFSLNVLLKNCPVKGHKIFNNCHEGIDWLNTAPSLLSNQLVKY